MNRKLRNRHRIMTTALAVIVPAVFLAGLAVRPVMPVSGTLPDAAGTDAVTNAQVVIGGKSFGYGPVVSDQAVTAVVLSPGDHRTALAMPDVLIYWSAQNPAGRSNPVDDAYLVGTLAPSQKRAYALPPAAASTPGYLSFYSLAARQMLPVEPDGALYVGRAE